MNTLSIESHLQPVSEGCWDIRDQIRASESDERGVIADTRAAVGTMPPDSEQNVRSAKRDKIHNNVRRHRRRSKTFFTSEDTREGVDIHLSRSARKLVFLYSVSRV